MAATIEMKAIFAIEAEARRLERERIMKLFEAMKEEVCRHVPAGNDLVAVQEIFEQFKESVAPA